MSATKNLGPRLRAARLDAGLSLSRMAELTHFSKPYLGQIETEVRAVTIDVLHAYERVLGADMWRTEITHPELVRIKGTQRIAALVRSVQSGDPDIFARKPTATTTEIAVGSRLDPDGVRNFQRWMTEGDTPTLRTNALSVIGMLPGQRNADLVVRVLEDDARVRYLSVASGISRLTQVDWQTALHATDDLRSHPDPKKLARRAAKEAVDPRSTAGRWCAAYILRNLAPVIGK